MNHKLIGLAFVALAALGGCAAPMPSAGLSDVIERMRSYRLTGPAGEFEYSNTGYFVLALAIKLLNGGSADGGYYGYMRNRLLAIAGMRESGFSGEPRPPGVMDALPNHVRPPRFHEGQWLMGAGDLMTGGTGPDTLLGFGGGDLIRGEAGKDTIGGGGASDNLMGGGGPDKLDGGAARDFCNGGGGLDTARSCNITRRIP